MLTSALRQKTKPFRFPGWSMHTGTRVFHIIGANSWKPSPPACPVNPILVTRLQVPRCLCLGIAPTISPSKSHPVLYYSTASLGDCEHQDSRKSSTQPEPCKSYPWSGPRQRSPLKGERVEEGEAAETPWWAWVYTVRGTPQHSEGPRKESSPLHMLLLE